MVRTEDVDLLVDDVYGEDAKASARKTSQNHTNM